MCPLQGGQCGLFAAESVEEYSGNGMVYSKILIGIVTAAATGFGPRYEICATGRAFGKLDRLAILNKWCDDDGGCCIATAIVVVVDG